SARKTQYSRPGQRLRDTADGFKITRRRRRESSLDDIDIEPLELTRDRDLLFDIHRASGRLFAVAQRGVENPDVIGVGRYGCRVAHCNASILFNPRWEPRKRAWAGKKETPWAASSAHRPGRSSQIFKPSV